MSKEVIKSGGNNAIQQVGNLMEKVQKNQAGMIGAIALGAIAVASFAIKLVGDMAKK